MKSRETREQVQVYSVISQLYMINCKILPSLSSLHYPCTEYFWLH